MMRKEAGAFSGPADMPPGCTVQNTTHHITKRAEKAKNVEGACFTGFSHPECLLLISGRMDGRGCQPTSCVSHQDRAAILKL